MKGCFWIAGILAMAVLLIGQGFAQAEDHSSKWNQTSGANKIYASIYILNIGKLDEATGAFDIDLYLTLKSDRPYRSDGFEFVNGRIQNMNLIVDTPTEKFYRIQASLYSQMDFEDYPFDKKTLSVDIEDKNDDDDNVVYVYDAAHSGIDSDLALNGWQLDGFKGAVVSHNYRVYNQSFSRMEFDIMLRRPGVSSAIKSLLPIVFIIFAVILTSFIKEYEIETRLKINTSMLIAAVLFHVSIDSYLPPISYLTLADKLMMLTYVIILAMLFKDVRILMKMRTESSRMP